MEEKILEGGDIMLFLDDKTVAFATSHTLSINAETVEVTSKDNGSGKWKASAARKLAWTVSCDSLYSEKGDPTKKQNAFDDLFDLMVQRKALKAVMSKVKESDVDTIPAEGWTPSANQYQGNVIITSLEQNTPNGENATFKVSFEGVGELKHNPAVVSA